MSTDREQQIDEVVELATRIISGDLDFIDGCRLINDLRWELDDDGLDDRFEYFVLFEKKCFSIPPKESRHYWSETALEKYDAQEAELRSSCLDEFKNQCRRLIASYGRAA